MVSMLSFGCGSNKLIEYVRNKQKNNEKSVKEMAALFSTLPSMFGYNKH